MNVEEEFGVKLIIHEIPVTYEYVAEKVPFLWKAYNPMLVVHVGVSTLATGLTLELQAHKSGYCRKDVQGKLPPSHEVSSGKAEVIQPMFDVEDVCKAVDKAKIRVPVCCSSDAGRYLCEFTYFMSLNIDNLRTIFIHVPVLNKPYSAADLAEGIKTVLRVLIQELRAQNQEGLLNNEVCPQKVA
ncbi:pyroglutamyl-peptidase 1 isoform X2 [Cryptotermes secundus]|nr:pyroglutamyl-peptidase 1 isoform X2 [Cryptotermes secundus]